MTNEPMTNDQWAIEQAQARSVIYRLMARAFLYPDLMTAAAMKSGEFMAALEQAVVVLGEPYERALGSPLSTLRAQTEGLDFEQWQSEYVAVFGHTVPKDYPPYETQYGSAHVFMQAQELADIAAFYRAFGLEISEQAHERVDHISTELEFMGFLAFKEAYAHEHGHGDESITLVVEAQRRFLKEHLGRWAPAFCRLLKKRAGGFYGALAALTSAFLAAETEVMGVKPRQWAETDLRPVSEELEPGCFSCPFAASLG